LKLESAKDKLKCKYLYSGFFGTQNEKIFLFLLNQFICHSCLYSILKTVTSEQKVGEIFTKSHCKHLCEKLLTSNSFDGLIPPFALSHWPPSQIQSNCTYLYEAHCNPLFRYVFKYCNHYEAAFICGAKLFRFRMSA